MFLKYFQHFFKVGTLSCSRESIRLTYMSIWNLWPLHLFVSRLSCMKSVLVMILVKYLILFPHLWKRSGTTPPVCGSCPAQKRGGASGVLRVVFFKLSILRKSIFLVFSSVYHSILAPSSSTLHSWLIHFHMSQALMATLKIITVFPAIDK